MIHLEPITYDNINDFQGTSYDNLSIEKKQTLISESIQKIHEGAYFEFLVVYDNDDVVGFMNLSAHSEHIISCGPEIKDCFRKRGFGFSAETEALKYAKEKGYTIAVATVQENNAASIALHEKLHFELYKNMKARAAKQCAFISRHYNVPMEKSGLEVCLW